MNKVLVGGISPEGEHILTSYLNVFMPDAVIIPLKPAGISGQLAINAKKSDCALVIIDESLYQECVGKVDNVLSLPKVHKYINDEGLNQFLISKFGQLSGVDVHETATIPPDILMKQEAIPEEAYIPKNADIYSEPNSYTPTPDQLVAGTSGIINSVSEDIEDNLAVSDDDYVDQENNNDIIIKELKDKLAKSEMLVKNLTMQLKDNGSDDVEEFVKRIKELETLVEEKESALKDMESNSYLQLGKVARAEQIINEVSDLKSEIRRVNEDKSAIIYERDKLQGKVDLLSRQVDDLKTEAVQITVLTQDVIDKTAEIESLNSSLSAKTDECSQISKKLSGVEQSLNESNKKVEELSGVVDEEKKSSEELRTQLSTANTTINNLNKDLSDAMELIESADTEKSKYAEELNKLKESVSDYEHIKEDLSKKVNSLEEQNASLTSEVEANKEENEDLSKKVSSLEEQNASLKAKLESNDEVASSLKEMEKLNDDLDSKIDSLEKDLDESRRRASELESEVKTLTNDLSISRGRVSELEKINESCNETINRLEKENSDYSESVESLTAQADQLIKGIGETNSVNDEITKLRDDLDKERQKSARLESELEVAKNNDDSGKTSELRLKIAKLRNELDKTKNELSSLKSGNDNSSELESLRDELVETRKRCGDLEINIEEQKSVIDDLTEGIFGQMANVALPKVPYDINLKSNMSSLPNFVCVAGGSYDSSSVVYSTLRRSCVTNATKKVLIVDLVTDSKVDREFGTKLIPCPISWLNGSEQFNNFLAHTRLANVQVISTALAYLNDLYLLKVDWESRLRELDGYADVIVVSVGCLNNLVSKVLFNAFSKIMKTYVITTASPINLRSAYLNLSGIKNISPNVTVECVNFDDKASKMMYQKLVSKFKAQILKDSDVLLL